MFVTFAVAVFVLRVGGIGCSESCESSQDGVCDDGGSGSDYDNCAFGSDCEVELPSKNALSKQQLWCFVSELSSSQSTFSSFFQTPSIL
jgi:hypothetical protein